MLELAAYVDERREQQLRARFDGVTVTDVEPGWEARWRAFHRPIRIGPLWIGPPWERAPGDAIPVVIDPGRAFGTGAHPTTRLCLALLLALPRGGLLDLGCGSGVLAIAAARLGFSPVRAVDVDPEAVAAASANAAANDVDVEVVEADAAAAAVDPVAVAVANISLEVIAGLAVSFRASRVVTSGYLASSSPRLGGYRVTGRRELDGWAAHLHVRE